MHRERDKQTHAHKRQPAHSNAAHDNRPTHNSKTQTQTQTQTQTHVDPAHSSHGEYKQAQHDRLHNNGTQPDKANTQQQHTRAPSSETALTSLQGCMCVPCVCEREEQKGECVQVHVSVSVCVVFAWRNAIAEVFKPHQFGSMDGKNKHTVWFT